MSLEPAKQWSLKDKLREQAEKEEKLDKALDLPVKPKAKKLKVELGGKKNKK